MYAMYLRLSSEFHKHKRGKTGGSYSSIDWLFSSPIVKICLLASELIRALAMVSEFAFVAWRNNFLRTDTRVNNKGMG